MLISAKNDVGDLIFSPQVVQLLLNSPSRRIWAMGELGLCAHGWTLPSPVVLLERLLFTQLQNYQPETMLYFNATAETAEKKQANKQNKNEMLGTMPWYYPYTVKSVNHN